METTCSSEISVYFQRSARRYIPDGRTHQTKVTLTINSFRLFILRHRLHFCEGAVTPVGVTFIDQLVPVDIVLILLEQMGIIREINGTICMERASERKAPVHGSIRDCVPMATSRHQAKVAPTARSQAMIHLRNTDPTMIRCDDNIQLLHHVSMTRFISYQARMIQFLNPCTVTIWTVD